MRDRQPTQPGRVKITPENGEAYYATMEMADEPTELGTPPTKANLLTDETEIALFGSAANRTVNDAFMGLGAQLKLIMSDMASITVTVKDHAGNPVKNVLVSGVYSETGSAVYTNGNGVATGYIAEGSQTISVKGYADLSDVSKTLTVVKGSTVTETLTPTRKNFVKVTSSKSIKFSGNVSTIDASVVGGGAGGEYSVANGNDAISGAGGSGGYVVTTDGINVNANELYQVVIGSGGKGGGQTSLASASTGGGTSSAFGITANGGSAGTVGQILGTYSVMSKPGAGNGAGGTGVDGRSQARKDGNAGGNGKVAAYSSFTETATWGAGGGSGGVGTGSAAGNGGSAGGGKGGKCDFSDSSRAGANATANTGSGGGGGAAFTEFSDDWYAYDGKGGNGAAGVVTARIHFDFGDLAA